MNQSTQTKGGRVRRTASAASVAALVVALVGTAVSTTAAEDACGVTGGEGGGSSICGYVKTTDGTPVENVFVTANGGDSIVTTNADGFYVIEGLSPGSNTVVVDTSDPDFPDDSQVSPLSTVVVVGDADGNPTAHPNVNFTVSSITGGEENLEIVPAPCDFVTSGGFVMSDTNKKISFGAHGGCKNGEFWGHVNVVDHSTGYHINSDEITGFIAPLGVAEPTRDICGWASTNNNADAPLVRFRVRLRDNGEPGSLDLWGIVLGPQAAVPYSVAPRLLSAQKPGGGNVQLHKPNPSTTAPSPVPSDFDMCGGVTFP